MHHYFNAPTTDLAVMREQAQARLKKGVSKYGAQTESVIHLHKADLTCRGHEHEFYPLDDDKELPKRFWEAIEEAEEMEHTR